MDDNSPESKELMIREIEYADSVSGYIAGCHKEIELLSIPDTAYFQKYIAENETKSLEYLKAPSKRKR